MANEYNHKQVESKWQKKWYESKPQKAIDFDKNPKYYTLVEFPYPSGEGLHLGHAFTNVILDILARKKRMDGFNVLYPMGWDAFGLPTENYAIKTGMQPSLVTKKNTDNFRKQMKKLALAYNWDREVNTTDPDYYKWTQWIFLKFFEKRLAYKAEAPVGWCPSCKIILANEEVLDGECERCGTTIEHKMQKQWMLKITAYADRLADELDLVDYPESAKTAQRNWIGRTEGVTVSFELENDEHSLKKIEVFTTRIETLYGATFVVVAPEHPLSEVIAKTNKGLAKYVSQALRKSERERKELVKIKTGIDTGVKVINPANGHKIPVWVSNFILSGYGTGAVMGVPAHDQRDMDFALKFNLQVKQVFEPGFESCDFSDSGDLIEHADKKIKQEIEDVKKQIKNGKAYEGLIGKIINSGHWSGSRMPESREQIIRDVEKKGWGKSGTTYHLRDWVFSRQHYWGEPIPIVNCPKCGLVPIPENQLPLELPKVKNYQPTDTGESPLANIDEWVNTTCPQCEGKAKRETDTMPNWAGSSWYFLRYCDPKNHNAFADYKKLDYWMPVDLYLGGAEHTTLHLLYSRFWHKFLNDLNLVPGKEPYLARRQHGIILAEDGTKMSKSKGNVINPDDMVEKYGADTLRVYLAFMGPYDQTMPWSTSGIEGARRFINRIWNIFQKKDKFSKKSSELLEKSLNETIRKVGEDIDNLKHNTAVAALMTFLNNWELPKETLNKQDAQKFLIILAPFAPFLSEELWTDLGKEEASVHQQQWPKAKKIKKDYLDIAVMVDGKQRSVIRLRNNNDIDRQEYVVKSAKKDEKISRYLKGKAVKRTVYVKGKVINFVTKGQVPIKMHTVSMM